MANARTYRPYGAMRRKAEYLKEQTAKVCREVGHNYPEPDETPRRYPSNSDICLRCGERK